MRLTASHAGVMELADVLDSKSSGSDTVPVRPRSPAPNKSGSTKVEPLLFRCVATHRTLLRGSVGRMTYIASSKRVRI